MLLIKTSMNTLGAVLREAKHASIGKPKHVKPGDIILVSQTKNTTPPNQKSIRWIMEYIDTREDINNDSDRIWGRHWRYIIEAKNVRYVEPFNIDEIQVTKKDYGPAVAFSTIEPEDETAILSWIGEAAEDHRDERKEIAEEFRGNNILNHDELIASLDKKYAGTPKYIQKVVNQMQRPSALKDAILARDGTRCRICRSEGFKKKDGRLYAETHHMIELNKQAPNTLQSWNILVVCPTCHKKLHYAQVRTDFLNPGWRISINGQEHVIR